MGRRTLVVGPSSGLAEEFVLSAPSAWAFEGVGRRAAVLTASRYDAVHVVDAQDLGPLEFAVRANECDTVVSFLQAGDRDRCGAERPTPEELPSGEAWEINVLATEAIGRAAVSEHKRVVLVSTDEVFSERGGPASESSEPVPWRENSSWYGGTRAEGETLMRRLGGSVAILRVSALFGWSTTTECDRRWAIELGAGRPGAPDVLQPTFVPDALAALRKLLEHPVSGTFHIGVRTAVPRAYLLDGLRRTVGGPEGAPTGIPERHPGLVTGRLMDLGVRPTEVAEAFESMRARRSGA